MILCIYLLATAPTQGLNRWLGEWQRSIAAPAISYSSPKINHTWALWIPGWTTSAVCIISQIPWATCIDTGISLAKPAHPTSHTHQSPSTLLPRRPTSEHKACRMRPRKATWDGLCRGKHLQALPRLQSHKPSTIRHQLCHPLRVPPFKAQPHQLMGHPMQARRTFCHMKTNGLIRFMDWALHRGS